MRLSITTLFLAALALPAQADILIGIAGPLSGTNAAFGNELRIGVSAAVQAVNTAGGINGEPLALVEGDDGCDSRRAIDVAKDFANKDVRLVVGHFCSSASIAAAPTYNAAGILMISPSATLPDLTSKNMWNVFRLTGRDDLQADLAATRIKASGQTAEAVLFTDGQPETAGLALRFRNAVQNLKSVTVKAGDARLPQDTTLLTATAGYLALQAADAAVIAKELRKLNPSIALYGSDLLQSETYASRAADAASGTLVSVLGDPATTADPRRGNAVIGAEGASLPAYAAVESFVAAAKARGVNDSRAMATWLSGGNEVNTIIGSVRFNASGDLQQQPYVWYQWRDGNFVPEQPTQ